MMKRKTCPCSRSVMKISVILIEKTYILSSISYSLSIRAITSICIFNSSKKGQPHDNSSSNIYMYYVCIQCVLELIVLKNHIFSNIILVLDASFEHVKITASFALHMIFAYSFKKCIRFTMTHKIILHNINWHLY